MKTIEKIAASIQSLKNEANELACGASALEDNLTNLQAELRSLSKNNPPTTTIHTNDASKIRKFLEDYRNVLYVTGVSNTAVINRLIDLLPSA